MRRLLAVSLIVIALAGCVGPPQAPEAPPAPVASPTPRPVPPPPAPLASDWNDWPFTPGEWRYRQEPSRSTASFATSTGAVELICDRSSHQITLGIGSGSATIRTTTISRSITPVSDRAPSYGTVGFGANDPLLDAIAFSRGRFVIEQTGRPLLVLPPHAEIGRVIEDCRG